MKGVFYYGRKKFKLFSMLRKRFRFQLNGTDDIGEGA